LLLLGLCHLSLHLVIVVAVRRLAGDEAALHSPQGPRGPDLVVMWPSSWPSSLLLLVFVKFG
jgi:hypothetical protein